MYRGIIDDYSNSTQEDRSEANHSATPYASPIQPIDLSGIQGIVDEAPRPENNFSIDVDLDEEIADAQEENHRSLSILPKSSVADTG